MNSPYYNREGLCFPRMESVLFLTSVINRCTFQFNHNDLDRCIIETINSFRSFTKMITFALEYEERFD
ncbi:MAG: hypothetical protein E2O86_01020 [Bacteroidetes bacterium]|nr:MAG: hypothetical protein E2O86_01020 [Bacteroidota bacterium]